MFKQYYYRASVDAVNVFPLARFPGFRHHSLKVRHWPFETEIRRHVFIQMIFVIFYPRGLRRQSVFKQEIDKYLNIK